MAPTIRTHNLPRLRFHSSPRHQVQLICFLLIAVMSWGSPDRLPSTLCSFFGNVLPEHHLLELPAQASRDSEAENEPLFDFWNQALHSQCVDDALNAPEMPATADTVAFEVETEEMRSDFQWNRHTLRHVVLESQGSSPDVEAIPSLITTLYEHFGHAVEADSEIRGILPKRFVAENPVDSGFEKYVRTHCKIRKRDLKPNALARMRDLQMLFQELECSAVVRLTHSDEQNVGCIFGFTRMFVDEVAVFNAHVTRMVLEDNSRCWHANGRRTLSQPSSTVYELLRQLGVHPVKGTRCNEGTPSGTRDFMFYRQYAFDFERLQRNCSRLKIGVIGNRRP